MFDNTINIITALNALNKGDSVFVDYDDTLFCNRTQRANTALINALKDAQSKGINVILWTAADYYKCNARVEYMQKVHNLTFNNVYCNIHKGNLIIDNLALNPNKNFIKV